MTELQTWTKSRRLNELIEDWELLGHFLRAYLGIRVIPAEKDGQFMRLKARIAHLLPALEGVDGVQGRRSESEGMYKEMVALLNSFPSLETHYALSEDDREEVINNWHHIYLYLNKVQGYYPHRPLSRTILEHWLTRFVLKVAVVSAAVVLIAAALDIDLGRMVAGIPGSIGDVARAGGGVGGRLETAAGSWSRDAQGLYEQAIGRLGEWAVIGMVVVLLAGSTVLIGYRGRRQ